MNKHKNNTTLHKNNTTLVHSRMKLFDNIIRLDLKNQSYLKNQS
jgi:hypothetical protein